MLTTKFIGLRNKKFSMKIRSYIIDSNYAVMDSTTNITLKFKNTFGNVPAGFARDYVLITNGRYENVTEGDNNISSSNRNQNLSLPPEYKLHQNYPNPFNPITKINYSLAKEGLVKIIIYNILGKEIVILVNETKISGEYTVDFDASEYSLPSGIYYYKLVTDGYTDTKKMLLIK